MRGHLLTHHFKVCYEIGLKKDIAEYVLVAFYNDNEITEELLTYILYSFISITIICFKISQGNTLLEFRSRPCIYCFVMMTYFSKN